MSETQPTRVDLVASGSTPYRKCGCGEWVVFITGTTVAVAAIIIGVTISILASRTYGSEYFKYSTSNVREVSLERISSFEGHRRPVRALAHNPILDRVYSAAEDGLVIEWLPSAAFDNSVNHTLPNATGPVYALAVHPNGTNFFSGGVDGIFVHTVGAPLNIVRFGPADVPSYALAISPDGESLFSGSDSGTVREFNTTTGNVIRVYSTGTASPITSVAFNAQSRMMYSGSNDGVTEWDASTRIFKAIVRDYFDEPLKNISALAVSSDGTLYAASNKGVYRRNVTSFPDPSYLRLVLTDRALSLSIASNIIVPVRSFSGHGATSQWQFSQILFAGFAGYLSAMTSTDSGLGLSGTDE
ncbi:hypothetical protein HK102_007864, partial [Quaeritorhiza haematococci]